MCGYLLLKVLKSTDVHQLSVRIKAEGQKMHHMPAVGTGSVVWLALTPPPPSPPLPIVGSPLTTCHPSCRNSLSHCELSLLFVHPPAARR